MKNATYTEILILSILACMLASTFAVVPVWIGVCVAYVAFLKSCGITRFAAITHRNGYMLVNLNVAPRMSLCLVVRDVQPQPRYNVWQLQAKGMVA